jgi:hypothetical protein
MYVCMYVGYVRKHEGYCTKLKEVKYVLIQES